MVRSRNKKKSPKNKSIKKSRKRSQRRSRQYNTKIHPIVYKHNSRYNSIADDFITDTEQKYIEKMTIINHNRFLDNTIQFFQNELKLYYDNCDHIKDEDEQEECMREISDKYNLFNQVDILEQLYENAKSLYDLLYFDYSFLSDKLYGTFSYNGRFGEGDGSDHINAGGNLKTMVKYGLLTVDGQSNTVHIDNEEMHANQYSYIEFYALDDMSEKLYSKLKQNPNLVIIVQKYNDKSNDTFQDTRRGEMITLPVTAELVFSNYDINGLEIVKSTYPDLDIISAKKYPRFFKQFHLDGPKNVQEILKKTYHWNVFTKATKTDNDDGINGYISPNGLPNVEDVIADVLTNPQNNFEVVLHL